MQFLKNIEARNEWVEVFNDTSPLAPYKLCNLFGIEYKGFTKGGEHIWEETVEAIYSLLESSNKLSTKRYEVKFEQNSVCVKVSEFDCVTSNIEFVKKTTLANIDNVFISNSTTHQFGLFSKVNFNHGQLIGRLDGQKMPYRQWLNLRENMKDFTKGLENYFFMEWNMLKDGSVLARPYRTFYSYINHSLTPNCKVKEVDDRVLLYTSAYIKKGDELLIDYTDEKLPDDYLTDNSNSFLFKKEF